MPSLTRFAGWEVRKEKLLESDNNGSFVQLLEREASKSLKAFSSQGNLGH
jgi:hypothetical protein